MPTPPPLPLPTCFFAVFRVNETPLGAMVSRRPVLPWAVDSGGTTVERLSSVMAPAGSWSSFLLKYTREVFRREHHASLRPPTSSHPVRLGPADDASSRGSFNETPVS